MRKSKNKKKKRRLIPWYKEGDLVFVSGYGIATIKFCEIKDGAVHYRVSLNRKDQSFPSSKFAIFKPNVKEAVLPDLNYVFRMLSETTAYHSAYELLVTNIFFLSRVYINASENIEKLKLKNKTLHYRLAFAVVLGVISLFINLYLCLP